MTKSVWIGLALVLAVAAPVAAADIEGKIRSVETADRAIVLEDGTRLWIAEGVPMDDLKEGASVKASYEERDGKNVVTNVQVSN